MDPGLPTGPPFRFIVPHGTGHGEVIPYPQRIRPSHFFLAFARQALEGNRLLP
jgi:hypothetical protein